MKKKKSVRIWDDEEELTVLKGLVDFRAKTEFPSKIDWNSLYRFIGGSTSAKFSKRQLFKKISELKRRFIIHYNKINQGHDPHFTSSTGSEAFGFSIMLWGQNEAGFGHSGTENGTAAQNGGDILKEQVEVTNVEHGKSQNDNGTKNMIAAKESHDNDDVELCSVRDAFETMMSQGLSEGLSDYQKKLQLEKLMNLGGSKRRELSEEWKALCVEERRLHVKRLRFFVKLAEAANDS